MLGVEDEARYCSYKLTAEPGSLLVLYTDGVIEIDRDMVAGERRLVDIACDVVRHGVQTQPRRSSTRYSSNAGPRTMQRF